METIYIFKTIFPSLYRIIKSIVPNVFCNNQDGEIGFFTFTSGSDFLLKIIVITVKEYNIMKSFNRFIWNIKIYVHVIYMMRSPTTLMPRFAY